MHDYIVYIDELYKISFNECLYKNIKFYENIRLFISNKIEKPILDNVNYLIINCETNDIVFVFDDYAIMNNHSEGNDRYSVFELFNHPFLLSGEINVISESLTIFIDSCVNDKSNESVKYLYHKLSEFANKYITIYDILCNLTVSTNIKSVNN